MSRSKIDDAVNNVGKDIGGFLGEKEPVKMTWLELANDIHKNAVDHGWHENIGTEAWETEKTLMIQTEVAEIVEDLRVGKLSTVIAESGKPEGLPSEVADVVIRVLDYICGRVSSNGDASIDELQFVTATLQMTEVEDDYGGAVNEVLLDMFKFQPKYIIDLCKLISQLFKFDLYEEVLQKHRYNKTRPYRHGNKTL
jgi:hypothetical protein